MDDPNRGRRSTASFAVFLFFLIILSALTLTLTLGACSHHSEAGAILTIDTDGVELLMSTVPHGDHPTGLRDLTTGSVEKDFLMSISEFTTAQACGVLNWAESRGYLTDNSEMHNFISPDGIFYGSQLLIRLNSSNGSIRRNDSGFFARPGYGDYPLAEVSWFGSIMLCNWITEMVFGDTDDIVYSGISEEWNHVDTVMNTEAQGFRLPSDTEWERAARYIDGKKWLPGDHVSGDASAACYDRDGTLNGKPESVVYPDYAWFAGNSIEPGSSEIANGRGLHPVGTAGSASEIIYTGNANHLGMYDLGGNVWEWCFDQYYHMRFIRGGCWNGSRSYLRVGFRENFNPTYCGTLVGFRLAMNYRQFSQ